MLRDSYGVLNETGKTLSSLVVSVSHQVLESLASLKVTKSLEQSGETSKSLKNLEEGLLVLDKV